jgi:hypothetical protein
MLLKGIQPADLPVRRNVHLLRVRVFYGETPFGSDADALHVEPFIGEGKVYGDGVEEN